jgi:signal transduction histidine kinase
MHHLQSIYDAINRLTKLNQSLLLLSKIENNQFKESQLIRIDDLIKEKLIQLDEIIQSKQLSLSSVFSPVNVLMNQTLADILANNLLTNAIRHNFMAGSISVETSANSIRIRNTAETETLDKNSVFNRFEKGTSSDGIGLGLAIVKQICDIYNFSIDYSYHEQMHSSERELKKLFINTYF